MSANFHSFRQYCNPNGQWRFISRIILLTLKQNIHTWPKLLKLSWNRNPRHSTRSKPLAVVVSRYCNMKYHTWADVSINKNWNPSFVIVKLLSPFSLRNNKYYNETVKLSTVFEFGPTSSWVQREQEFWQRQQKCLPAAGSRPCSAAHTPTFPWHSCREKKSPCLWDQIAEEVSDSIHCPCRDGQFYCK